MILILIYRCHLSGSSTRENRSSSGAESRRSFTAITTLNTLGSAARFRLEHIQPDNPQQNAYIERYNRTVRYDWLSYYLFESIEDVQNDATDWMWTYNHERPNMALGGITSKQKSVLFNPLYF